MVMDGHKTNKLEICVKSVSRHVYQWQTNNYKQLHSCMWKATVLTARTLSVTISSHKNQSI